MSKNLIILFFLSAMILLWKINPIIVSPIYPNVGNPPPCSSGYTEYRCCGNDGACYAPWESFACPCIGKTCKPWFTCVYTGGGGGGNACDPYCSDAYSVAETCAVGCGGYCGVNCDPPPPPPTATPTPTPIPPDFVVSTLEARNSDGDLEDYFKVGQRVYPRIVVRNQGSYNALQTYYTRIYWDEDNTSAYTTLTMNTPFNAGSSRSFEPWTDGTNADKFTSPKTAVLTEAGRQYLLARVNQGNAGPETSYANNERRTGFNVRAHFEAYACNDKGENGQCKNTGDRSKKDITISLDESVTSGNGFETHIKSVATATNGIADFSYRMDGHYKFSLADVDGNDGWKVLGVRNNGGAWSSSTSCTLHVGPDFNCEFALVPLHTLTGTVFIDNNRNGIKDVEDTDGLGSVAVRLTGTATKDTTTNSAGKYTFRDLRAGNYTVQITVPTDYEAFPGNTLTVSPAITVGQDGPNTFTEDIGINEICSLSGRVYVDSDKSGSYDPDKDFPISGRRVYTEGQEELETTTGSDGRYSIGGMSPGNYFVNVSNPDGYNSLDTNPRQLTVTDCNNIPGQNFKLFGAYSISGNAFFDANGDKVKGDGEVNIAANPNVSIVDLDGRPKAYRTNLNDGTYLMENLINATYTVRYGGLPNGFYMVHPTNAIPPSFSATVGAGCTEATPAPGGSCNGLSLEDVDFAVDSGRSWIRTYGLDIRFDAGINNPVPTSPDVACGGAYTIVNGSGTTSSVAFSGNASAEFHNGDASSSNWIVGSSNYQEIFTSHSSAGTETSYDYFQSVMRQSNITPINLTTVCPDLESCTLPNNMANGVYQATGDVTLTGSSTLPANRDFVILVNGKLTINGTVDVPNTSTATFSVSDDIVVPANIGQAASCPAPANAQIDGFFSTDKNFIVESAADCTTDTPDLQLNMQGSVVVNANRANNGQFVNNRTLCDSGNLQFPSFTVKDRPDMILNAPDFLRVPTYIWQEVAPN